MSIAELFEGGAMKEHQGAFRNLVMLAKADGVISPEERKMLNRMAQRLDLTETQVEEILKNPESFPIYPPSNVQDRRERMVDLVRMMMVDGALDERELNALHRCAIGLGYISDDIPHMVNRIRFHLNSGLDRSGVIDAMLAEQ